MELTRTQVIDGVLAEYDNFGKLIANLTPEQWATATRCDKWEVRDVAGHVVGLAADVAAGAAGRRTADDQARELRGGTPAELAAALADSVDQVRPLLGLLDDAAWHGPSPVPDLTMAEGVHGLLFDTYVHADDIRASLGLPAEAGAGVAACVSFLERRLRAGGWGPAHVALDGLPPFQLGTGGPRVGGDPLRFVLVGTGRADPAELGLDETVNIYR